MVRCIVDRKLYQWLCKVLIITDWSDIMTYIYIHTARALTNTVGGEYEYIHEYRVTNTNTVFALVFRSFKQNVILRNKNAS